MAKGIEWFEVNSYGELKVKTRGGKYDHSIEHTYYNVPTEIIKKFINASTAPTTEDVNDWLNTYRSRQSKDNSGCCHSTNFWKSK